VSKQKHSAAIRCTLKFQMESAENQKPNSAVERKEKAWLAHAIAR